jgi:hypothetical protein
MRCRASHTSTIAPTRTLLGRLSSRSPVSICLTNRLLILIAATTSQRLLNNVVMKKGQFGVDPGTDENVRPRPMEVRAITEQVAERMIELLHRLTGIAHLRTDAGIRQKDLLDGEYKSSSQCMLSPSATKRRPGSTIMCGARRSTRRIIPIDGHASRHVILSKAFSLLRLPGH